MRFCRLFQTLRHIPPKQLFWQVFRFFFNKSPSKKIYKFHFSARSLRVVSSSYSKVDDNNVFIFGSKLKIISSKLPSDIKQDYLYDFSYNYLDFIFSPKLHLDDALEFIENYPNENNRFEWHPYTVSKRLINLICFCVVNFENIPKNKIENIENQASRMYGFLKENIEFHLGANHVLTNYAALSIAQLFIKENTCSNAPSYIDLYIEQYNLQFSKDIHYERSVAYSRQLLSEFLLVAQFYNELKNEFFFEKNSKIIDSISALDSLGSMFGDNILEQSPNLSDISDQFFCVYQRPPLKKTDKKKYDIEGYYLLESNGFKALIDAGEPSPKNNPGHAHDSTGAFSISVEGLPLIVNGIVSTYERCDRRIEERSRLVYSKPQNMGVAQETWASFRVASRRKPQCLDVENGVLINVYTSNDGFQRGVFETPQGLTMFDKMLNPEGSKIISQFIISPDFKIEEHIDNKLTLRHKSSRIRVLLSYSKETKLKNKNVILGVGYGKTKMHEALLLEGFGKELNLNITKEYS